MRKQQPQPSAPLEKKSVFLEVIRTDGFVDFWSWESAKFTVHESGDGRLAIQRRDRRESAATYSIHGWTRYRWIFVEPSRVEDRRADKHIP